MSYKDFQRMGPKNCKDNNGENTGKVCDNVAAQRKLKACGGFLRVPIERFVLGGYGVGRIGLAPVSRSMTLQGKQVIC